MKMRATWTREYEADPANYPQGATLEECAQLDAQADPVDLLDAPDAIFTVSPVVESTWLLRLQAEYDDLCTRTKKLHDFMLKPEYPRLGIVQQRLMADQYVQMDALMTTLANRLKDANRHA